MPAFGRSMSATPAFGQATSAAPVFGQTASTIPAFGQTASTTPAFGQTASATPAFGQTASSTPAFGQTASATPAFGQTASSTPVFGQTASAAAPEFGQTVSAFGQTASPASVFGQSTHATPAFGQTASATPVFGQTSAALFGQTASTAPAFGQTAPAVPTFGQSSSATSAFGQTAPAFGQAQSKITAFGQTSTATTAFGQTASATPAFGQTVSATPAFGQTVSATLAFGQTASATSAFGQTATSPFGQTASATPAFGQTSSATSAFGQAASATPVFGQATASTFGQTVSATPAFGVFGQEASTAPKFEQTGSTASLFGQTSSKTAFGPKVSTTSLFGQASSTTPLFGQISSSSKLPFGQKASSTIDFGHTVATSSAVGGFASKPAFEQTMSDGGVFGQTSLNVFGHPASSASTFGKPTTTMSIFGKATTSASKFGQPTNPPSIFGQTTSSSSMFEDPTASTQKLGQTSIAAATFGQQSTASSMFGTHASSASIVEKPTTSAAAIFGKPATSASSIFGKPATSAASIFGKPATSAPSTFEKPATSAASTFGKPATSAASSSTFDKPATSAASTFTKPATAESKSIFGKSTSPMTIFGKTTTESGKSSSDQMDSSAAGVFGQKNAPGLLFGKPAVNRTSSEKTKIGSELFGKPVQESQAGVGEGSREPEVLFGRKQPGSSTSADPTGEAVPAAASSDRPLSPSAQQRRPASPPGGGEQKRAALKRRPGAGLFGRAIAGVSSERTGEEAPGDRADIPPRRPPSSYEAGQGEKDVEGGDLSPESQQKSGPRRLRRRSSVDVNTLVAIVCKNVPTSCNNKLALRKHFSKYGTISRLYTNPSKSTATIHFTDHESAENAKKKGKMIKQGLPPMQIFLSAYSQGSETGPRSVKAPPGLGSTWKTHSREVDDELASMRGTSDVSSTGFVVHNQPRQTEKRVRPLEASRGLRAGGDVGMAVGKRKIDGLARVRGGKTSRSEERMAAVKPVIPSEVQPVAPTEVKPVSMKSLINAVGHTTEDRLEILNNVDKIIRSAKGSTKHTDLASAVAIKGSCPDMCPERERYTRVFQRRLSVYEIVPGTDGPGQTPVVDHSRAVKEYSRSSADQDMPLPHSVRPPAVLQMTMDYLMTNVMDTGGEGRWEDWYDFLWDRTRGIRKDIIQQHLCDWSAADLTEKCTRLHIYCSERLCEEDPIIFDIKINNENLTKCLQSLKELYQDLASQDGISCSNEAEFRTYMVLMNLNEGDTLREVQELRQEVRESALVRFATAVYAALNSNNYVKFFKLMHSATFLNACIMHRYFTQVRTKALTVIVKAYRVPGHVIQYPLSEIVRHLAFEDESEAADFCSHHGLAVHDGQVAVDRRAFVQPEQAFGTRRAVRLVESKQTTSVGEVVCGGPLPPPTLHQPTSSFDANDRFQGGDFLTMAMETPTVTTKEPQDQPVVKSDPDSPSTQAETATASHAITVSHEAVKDVAKNLFLEVINDMVLEMCNSLMSDADCYFRCIQSIATELISDVTNTLTNDTCNEVMSETWAELTARQQQARAEEDARRRALMSAARDLACGEVVDEIVSAFVTQECSSIAQDQHREVQMTLERESSDRCTAALVDVLVAETIAAEINDITQTTYEVDVEERLRVLEERRRAVELLVKARYLQCWRNQHAGRMRLKRSMLSFPSAPSMKDPSAQFAALLPASEGMSHDSIHLGKKARLTLNSPDQVYETQQRVRLHVALLNYCKRLKRDHAWSPLDMVHVLHRQLTLRQARASDIKLNQLFWKLIISLPEMDESSTEDDNHRCDWLKAKFSKGAVPSDPQMEGKSEVLSLYTANRHGNQRQALSIHVRTAVGILSEADIELVAKKQLFMGCSAIMFLLRAADFTALDDDFWLEEQLRLKTVLLATPFSSTLPLVCLVPHPLTDHQHDTITDQLGLDMILEDGLISSSRVVVMETHVEEPETSRTLVVSVRWLAERCPEQLALKVVPLRDFVEDCLSQDFYTLIFQNLSQHKHNSLPHQSPRALIALYNAVVNHMVELVTHPDLAKVSWPLNEFTSYNEDHLSSDWNSRKRFASLEASLLSLRLPQFEFGGEQTGYWEESCEDVKAFVAAVSAQGGSDTALLSRTFWILHKSKRQSEDTRLTTHWKSQRHPRHVAIPWTDVILACIDYKLAQLECYDTLEPEGEIGREVTVCYLKNQAGHVTLPTAWLEATGVMLEQHVSIEDTMIGRQRGDDDVSHSQSWTDDIGDKSVTKATHQLLGSIAEEQVASQQFEDKLRKMLQPKLPDDLLNITSYDEQDATAIFGMTSLLSSPIFSLALTSKLDRKQERKRDVSSKCFPPQSLAEDVEELNHSLESQKAANSLYEMKLRMYMNEDLLW